MNLRRLPAYLTAAAELGLESAFWYALYQFERRSGLLRLQTPPRPTLADGPPDWFRVAAPLPPLPAAQALRACLGPEGCAALLAEAGEIAAGQVRLFGGPPLPLEFAAPPPEGWRHWSDYARPTFAGRDIKFTWEPARFGWAFTLARAYRLDGDERLAAAFWEHTERFLQAHPVNRGPQWVSGQEAALRLMALVFAAGCFAASPHSSAGRMMRLGVAIAEHAARIPSGHSYSAAQNNNHLLSEAAGLYTAGLALPAHPSAAGWRTFGWDVFQRGLQRQFAEDGSYTQHSANYHRLALHLALWMGALGRQAGKEYSALSLQRLRQGTAWLLALLDESGGVPNLGPNDGANFLRLDCAAQGDYRPALQAAGAAFLYAPPLPPGPWDEPRLWLDLPGRPPTAPRRRDPPIAPLVLRRGETGAYLRAARFTGRPGHADQLHLDLWRGGVNVLLDPGTYLYNADPPWDNRLVSAFVHNTVTVNGADQMERLGRFLYIRRAQARIIRDNGSRDGSVAAWHDGYRRLGVIHQRRVTCRTDDDWLVEDNLLPAAGRPPETISARLHWLLPDGEWALEGGPDAPALRLRLRLRLPGGWVRLRVQGAGPGAASLARAGALLAGAADGVDLPPRGWVSPTYSVLQPALSWAVTFGGALPMRITTQIAFETDGWAAGSGLSNPAA